MLRPAEPNSRTTLIALRARQSAHRLASEIAHQPIEPAEPDSPDVPFAKLSPPRLWYRYSFDCANPWKWIGVGLLWAGVFAAVLAGSHAG